MRESEMTKGGKQEVATVGHNTVHTSEALERAEHRLGPMQRIVP